MLMKPTQARDMALSMLRHQQQSVHGLLPIWSHMANDNWCMSGYHAVSVLADALLKTRASESRAEFTPAMPSAAEARLKVKTRASESRAEFTPAMPSAAEARLKVKTRASESRAEFTPAMPSAAEARLKVKGADIPVDEALKAMVTTSNVTYLDGMADYLRLGYVPMESSGTSASNTLEYCYDDWAILQTALLAGDDATAAIYHDRALTTDISSTPKRTSHGLKKRTAPLRLPSTRR
jgi:putative alpha-1,2-mannosidase